MMHTYRISRQQSEAVALTSASGQNMSVEISPDILLKDKSKIVVPSKSYDKLKYPLIWLWLTFLN
jgi:hypothetical protein